MSPSHEARRWRLTLASLSHLYPVSDHRLDVLADHPEWADHHDVHDMIGELTAGRMRRAPLPPVEDPRTEADVRRDPRVGDTVLRTDGRPFARAAAVLDGYVVVTVPDGHPLVWATKHWGFQGVAGDRYVHVPGDAPAVRDEAGDQGAWGYPEAYRTFAAYKATRKHLRRRRHDKESAHERVLRFALGRNDADYITEALNRADRGVYAGPPHTNRNYRPLYTHEDTPDDDHRLRSAHTARGSETLGDIWPGGAR